MKQNRMALTSIGLMTLCLVFSGTRLPAQSANEEKGPVTLTASLVGSSTVCLGEPILIKYVVKNSNDLPVVVSNTGNKGDTLGTEAFTEADGKALVPSANLLVAHYKSETFAVEAGTNIAGSSSQSWEALANAHIAFPRPGSYVLRVHVERPYVAGDPQQGACYVLKGDFVFPLTVVAANSAYLRSTAERLREGILRTKNVAAKATVIQALFSMPEVYAASSWQALVEEPKLDGPILSEVTEALASLNSLRAADLLAEVVWAPVQPSTSVDAAMASERLGEMRDASDPAVKKHIDDLTAQHQVAGNKIFALQ